MNDFAENKLLQKCLVQIEQQLGWGSSDSWHNEVFVELSDAILEATSVLLSATTLKRVWGKVNYESSPSIKTLNTLAQFAGYDSWLDFKNQQAQPRNRLLDKRMWQRGLILGALTVVLLFIISQLSMINIGSAGQPPVIPEGIRFSSQPVAKGIPNSVVFDLDLKGLDSDSLFIQQYWDETKTIKLHPGQQQATGIYYYPGYFRAKLLVDGHIIKEHDLFIRSGGWLGTIDYKPVPKYIPGNELLSGGLSFPEDAIQEIAVFEEPLYSGFHFVDDLRHVSADNFSLQAEVRNVFRDRWAVCQTFKLVILGTKGAMVIPFSIPGCVSDLGVMANDVYLSGKEHDLSDLGADFSTFRQVQLKVQDQHIRVFLDGEQIYSVSYNEPVGDLAGFRFRFLGAGEVRTLELFEAKGDLVYQGKFSLF